MTFLYPNMLFLIILVVILFALLLTQKESHAHFFSQEVMDKLRVSANTLPLQVRNWLYALVAVLLVLALANPVIQEGKVAVKAKSADIMIALDISDSMLAKDIYPNRLKAAKAKAMELLKLAPNERMGVIAFAKNSYLVAPLSFDHNAVGFLLRKLDTTSITEKGTSLLSMLEVVDRSIKKDAQKYLLVLSDGGDKKDFSKEIAFAKSKGITIFVLGVATKKGAPIQNQDGTFIKQHGEIIVSRLNENIAQLATKTGGVYIQSVRADADVKAMLSEIEKHSKKRELKSEEIERFEPLFYYPLALALLLFLVATTSRYKRNGSVALVFVAVFGTTLQDANAGLLDFMQVKAANAAYAKGHYKDAASEYNAFAQKSHNDASYYNAGNALYKQKKYTQARKSYEKASFTEPAQEAKRLANIGNTYVKEQKQASLQKAIEAYEKSLKLKEDKATRENLEAVKKALKKQQQKQQQQKEKKQDKKNKKEQNKKNQSKEKNKDKQKKDKKQKSESEKQSQEGEKSDEQSKDTKENQQQKEQAKKEKAKKDKAKQEQKKQEKQKMQELNKEKQKKDAKAQGAQKSQPMQMSNEEEKKWLNKLNQEQNSFMYRLNPEKQYEEDPNEKPW